jgi:hypothetical protein
LLFLGQQLSTIERLKMQTQNQFINKLPSKAYRLIAYLAVCMLLAGLLVPLKVSAAGQLTVRSLTLGSSAQGVQTSYSFALTTASTATIQSISAQICTAASGACTTPSGFTITGDAFGSTTFSGTWTNNTATAGQLRASATSAASTNSGTAKTVSWTSVTNPTTANQTFYARITTYSDAAWTTSVDTGTVAASTAQQISLSGTMDESLVFCVGTSITGQNCGTISGSSVNFGTFSSAATSSGTSVMAVSTNGVSGYAITVNGSTLTCSSCSGSPTIAALASQTASSIGTAQFGLNLKANTTPSVGANVSGSGSGTATGNYGTADQYRFVTGDSVASAAAASNANTFTTSYIVNVPGSQAAGTYTATMTYIATATF